MISISRLPARFTRRHGVDESTRKTIGNSYRTRGKFFSCEPATASHSKLNEKAYKIVTL